LRSFSVAAVYVEEQDALNFLGRQPALMPDEIAELLEDALSLADLEFVAGDVQLIAAGDQSDSQGLANGAKILISAAEKQQRFIAVFQVDGRLGHEPITFIATQVSRFAPGAYFDSRLGGRET